MSAPVRMNDSASYIKEGCELKGAKKSYESYANQAFRFYARNESGAEMLLLIESAGDEKATLRMYDWNVCDEVMRMFATDQRAILLDVYRRSGAITDVVVQVANDYDVTAMRVWRLLRKATREFATMKGLILCR